AAAPPRSSSWASRRRVRPMTSPAPPTWLRGWSGSGVSPPRSVPSVTGRRGRAETTRSPAAPMRRRHNAPSTRRWRCCCVMPRSGRPTTWKWFRRRTGWRAPATTRSPPCTAITRRGRTWRTASGRWRRSQPNSPAVPSRPFVSPWVIAMTVMLATFMEVLDTSVANVALPHIAGSLSATPEEATWVLTSYLVANPIILPMGAWFSMMFGRKRFYMICVGVFTASSLLCGMAPTLGLLIVFRVLQGLGGGALQPISQAILVESFPREKQGMAMAIFGMGVVLAPVIGPTLGGWITDNIGWGWIFFINVPIGILALLLTSSLVHDPPYLVRKSLGKDFQVDYMGFGLLALGLGSLEIVLDEGQRKDWMSSNYIVTFAIL